MESERKKDQTNFYMVAAWLLPLLYTHLCKNNFRTWLRAYSLRVWGHRYAHVTGNKDLILFYLYGTIYCTERGYIFYVSCQLFYYPKRFEKLL